MLSLTCRYDLVRFVVNMIPDEIVNFSNCMYIHFYSILVSNQSIYAKKL